MIRADRVGRVEEIGEFLVIKAEFVFARFCGWVLFVLFSVFLKKKYC